MVSFLADGSAARRPTRRERERADLRETIIEAALRIARAKGGWDDVTMREIARVIDYTAAALYHHFDNKDALLEAIRRRGYGMLAERFLSIGELEPRPRLFTIARYHVDFAFEQPELFMVMFGLRGALLENSQPVPEQQLVGSLLDDTFRSLIGNKQLNAPFDDEVDVLWASLHGIVSVALFGPLDGGIERARRLCDIAVGHLTKGLA
jgi:AcrR family transcriptional regulator